MLRSLQSSKPPLLIPILSQDIILCVSLLLKSLVYTSCVYLLTNSSLLHPLVTWWALSNPI